MSSINHELIQMFSFHFQFCISEFCMLHIFMVYCMSYIGITNHVEVGKPWQWHNRKQKGTMTKISEALWNKTRQLHMNSSQEESHSSLFPNLRRQKCKTIKLDLFSVLWSGEGPSNCISFHKTHESSSMS